jgi:hypothetical protein
VAEQKPKFDRMPKNVAEIFEALVSDVCNLCWNWDALCDLFAKGPERIEVLNYFAPFFFTQVRNAFLGDVVLRICHLTESAADGRGNANQSLHRLLEEIRSHDPDLIDSLQIGRKLDELVEACRTMRTMRNRRIAHRDWRRRGEPIPPTTKENIDAAIRLIQEIMNKIEFHFEERTSIYGYGGIPGNAECLAGLLKELRVRRDEYLKSMGVALPPKA